MQVFLDDFAVYSRREDHLDHLRMCLEKCRGSQLSLNPTKCVFRVMSGALLGHTVSNEGIAMDLEKVKIILQAPAPTIAKALSLFVGKNPVAQPDAPVLSRFRHSVSCNSAPITLPVERGGG